MIKKIRRFIARNIVNVGGWRTNRKIVVLESDDWGSIRMSSMNAYERLLKSGVPVDRSPYCRFDSLASESDLSLLFDVLSSCRDSNGNPSVITANVLVANPDFEKIRESNFQKYYYEKITETFKKFPEHDNCFSFWIEGKEKKLFHPQSHGREHLNHTYWLKLLQEDKYDFRLAFENGIWGLSSDVYPEMKRSVQASFDFTNRKEVDEQKEVIHSGLRMFKELFGYCSKSFIPTNYIWSTELNEVLKDNGVDYLQGMKYQKLPLQNDNKHKMVRHYLGDINQSGQTYLVRNCSFEPSLKKSNVDSVGNCLRAIEIAFRWKKPAIISTHRLNYIGYLDRNNRDQNLKLLKELLQMIVKKWPDVEFMTSDKLGRNVKKTID